ncbi:hypothetical protein [Aureimonas altamirensis]|uniref:hypothetical protein n=1 Tax=Aureimonas altamirensis TaxID=370622 RepID=UPI00301B4B38
MQLKAKKSFNYAGRDLKPGDEFSANANHINLLIKLDRAEYIREETISETPKQKGRSKNTLKDNDEHSRDIQTQ